MSFLKKVWKHFNIITTPQEPNEELSDTIVNGNRADLLYLPEESPARDLLYPILRWMDEETNGIKGRYSFEFEMTGEFYFKDIEEIIKMFKEYIKEHKEIYPYGDDFMLYFGVMKDGPLVISLFNGREHLLTYARAPRSPLRVPDNIEMVKKVFRKPEKKKEKKEETDDKA